MSQHQPTQNTNALNANLVAFIFIINFVVIGGLIFSTMPLTGLDSDDGDSVIVAQIDPTDTPLPSPTPLPPTATLTQLPTQTSPPSATPTTLPTATSTATVAEAVSQSASANSANTSYDPVLVEQGQQLFTLCAACHGPDARGLSNLGKDLVESEFVAGLTDEDLLTFIKTGRPIWDPLNTSGLDMPPKGGNPAMTDADTLAIIAYVRSLSSGNTRSGEGVVAANTSVPPTTAPTSTAIPSAILTESSVSAATSTPQPVDNAESSRGGADPALVEQGQQLFTLCAACHGPDARGLPNLGKDLVESEFVVGLSDADLLTFIKIGRPIWDPLNTSGLDMPPKGGNPAMTDADILAVIAYVRSLSASEE